MGGRINAAYNCVDRHVEAGNGDRVALHWVGEPEDDTRDLTYAELKDEVSKAANALTDLGVAAGDRVAIYMPMIPEAIVAMLACARIGAPHTVVFGGFSSDALATRLVDCQAKLVVTSDGGYRRGSASALKPAVDEARAKTASEGHEVEKVLVVRRTGQDLGENGWDDDVDVWWHDVVDGASAEHTPEAFDAEHPLYVMYTSGTTGKPKGILHTTGGYLVGAAYTHWAVFDLKPETDVYWCTADIGWVTGHSYIVYGPLANGATQVLYEGTPDSPERGRWWKIVQDYKVSLFYTAPTAIRSFMKQGQEIPDKFDMSSLRLLGLGRRADQPGGLRLVPARHRRRPHPGRRHLVADRDRRDHDQPAPRRHPRQAGLGDDPDPRRRRRRGHRGGRVGAERVRRLPGAHRAVALDAAHHLGRRRALPGDLLGEVRQAGLVLRGRRRQEGLRRRPVGARPGRRRHERLRPPALHDRDRVRAGLPPEGRRGRRGGRQGRGHRPGGLSRS